MLYGFVGNICGLFVGVVFLIWNVYWVVDVIFFGWFFEDVKFWI